MIIYPIVNSIVRPIIRSIIDPIFQPFSFSPLALFFAGEQGAWYDPSDLTTLFQDSAGTTPVTAHGQPVGLMLDKSGNGHHASQVTAASRPLYQSVGGLHYLLFDGVDDWLSTASIDFTATDKMSVFAGVRKLSDAVGGALIAELSINGATSNGAWFVYANAGGGTQWRAGSAGTSATTASHTEAAPVSTVTTILANIASPLLVLRTGGSERSRSVGTQGTGNFGNYPLYIGRRGGTTLPFNGHLYGLIIRGALTDDPTTIKVEQLLATKTGVTL